MRGKIIKGIAGFYYVHVMGNGIYECKAKGIFRKDNVKPLVGDNVEIEVLDEPLKKAEILLYGSFLGKYYPDTGQKQSADSTGSSQCGSGAGNFRYCQSAAQFQPSGPVFDYDAATGHSMHHLF